MKLVEAFRAARLRGVPIVGVTTPDQAATIQSLRETNGQEAPFLRWDVITGMVPLNGAGELALLRLAGIDPSTFNRESEEQVLAFQGQVKQLTQDPDAALALAKRLPGYDEAAQTLGAVLFVCNAHLFLGSDFPGHIPVRQAIANLRDPFKGSNRMLVLLGPELTLPLELAQDVILLDAPFPDDLQLAAIVREAYKGADLPEPDGETVAKATDALRGIAAFPAEQITAMSLRKAGLDLAALRERKRREIEKVRGLSVDWERITLAEVGGKAQIKKLLRGIFEGRSRPSVVVRVDEIEKFLAGSGTAGPGDSTGVAQDQVGVLLKEMEDNNWTGLILVSPPGCGKTMLSKALGGEFDVLSIALDLGGTKEKWVGSSEQHIRAAFKTIKAAAGVGGAFFIATCNKLESLPPELRRRFRLGIWYDDLPTAEEKAGIWRTHLEKYQGKGGGQLALDAPRPDDTGWTGADIRNCVDVAWRLGCSLTEAAQFLVPVSKSDPGSIERLRAMAKGAFLSTAYPGPYQGIDGPKAPGTADWSKDTPARKVKL